MLSVCGVMVGTSALDGLSGECTGPLFAPLNVYDDGQRLQVTNTYMNENQS